MSGLLADKVVVVSGVGPGLGRSIALQSAAAGAAVVLAARTEERLRAVADEIDAAGGQTLVVPTDITDDAQVQRLVETTVSQFGRVDALVDNAFALPSMKPLARTDFEQITASAELTVLGGLRVTQGLHRRTRRHRRRRGDDQLDGAAAQRAPLRQLQAGEGRAARDVADAGRRARREADPGQLRRTGLRLGRPLQWYFGEIAKKYEISPDDVYADTAKNSDLKRLPEPDEIARAVVFLASDWASAITGQTLDVNCGEYHA